MSNHNLSKQPDAQGCSFSKVVILSECVYPPADSYSVWRVLQQQISILTTLGLEVHVVMPGPHSDQPYRAHGAEFHFVRTSSTDEEVARIRTLDGPQTVFVLHDLACSYSGQKIFRHLVAELPLARFIHWFHGDPKLHSAWWRSQFPLPSSWYVTQLEGLVPLVVEAFRTPIARVRSIPNTVDFAGLFQLPTAALPMVERSRWFDAEIRVLYPATITTNKNWEALALLLSEMASRGSHVALIGLDTNPSQEDPSAVHAALERAGKDARGNFTWALASDCGFSSGTVHAVVKNLFHSSNLFVLPSKFETASLVLQEAALAKNLCVINEEFAPLRELVDDFALRINFSRLSSTPEYRIQCALRILNDVRTNPVLAMQNIRLKKGGALVAVEKYRALLNDVAQTPLSLIDQVLAYPALSQPFRWVMNALWDTHGWIKELPLCPGADLDQVFLHIVKVLQTVERTQGLRGLSDLYTSLVFFEAALGNAAPSQFASSSSALADGVVAIPWNSTVDQYARSSTGPESLAQLAESLSIAAEGRNNLPTAADSIANSAASDSEPPVSPGEILARSSAILLIARGTPVQKRRQVELRGEDWETLHSYLEHYPSMGLPTSFETLQENGFLRG